MESRGEREGREGRMEEERWGGGKHKTKMIIMVFRRGGKGKRDALEGEREERRGRACSLAKERARMGGDGKREEKGRVDLAGGARFGTEGKAQCRSLSSPLLSSPLLSSPLLSLGKEGREERHRSARSAYSAYNLKREEGRWREGQEKRGDEGSGRGEERKRKGRRKGTGGRVVERKERRDSNGVWGAGGDKRHRRARSA